MKKMLSLVLILCFIISLSMTAFANDIIINQDNVDKNAQIPISANAFPTYSVTIPATVKIDDIAIIKADNVLTEADKAIKVTITGTNQTNNAFSVSTVGGINLDYVIKKSDKTELKLNEPISFEQDGSETLSFELVSTNQVFAGNYNATVTFKLEYTNK